MASISYADGNNQMKKIIPKFGFTIAFSILLFIGFILPVVTQFQSKDIEKPNITVQLQDMKVLRGEQVILVCASVGNPVPQIKWLVNDNENLQRRYSIFNVSPQKSVLRLNPVETRDNRSHITCQSISLMGSAYSHATLSIYKKKEDLPRGFPVLTSKSSVIVNEKNSRVILECNVQSSPKANILWFKDSIPVDLENPRFRLLASGSLEINKTLEEDDGRYECMASNYHGSIVSPVIRLMIRVSYFAPHFINLPKDHTVMPGSSLTLICKAVGNPVPHVFWKCGQIILRSHSSNSTKDIGESTVILSDLSESLQCTCVAKNSKESIEHVIQISIQETSTTTLNIQISNVMATSLMVSWSSRVLKSEYYIYQISVQKTEDLNTGKNTTIKKQTSKIASSDKLIHSNIENLLAFTNYSVWVEIMYPKEEHTRSNIITFITLQLPPSSAPKNVELSAISNRAVAVIWEPPEEPNGLITAYNIYYTLYTNKALALWNKYTLKIEDDDISKRRTSVISHLLNNVTYYICVSAQNSAGSGPVTEVYPIIVRAGVVQGPKQLRAVPKSSSEIQLFWQPLIPGTLINILSYKLVYMIKGQPDEKTQKIWKYTQDQSEISVGNLLPNTTYILHLSAITTSGSGMVSSVEGRTYDTVCYKKVENVKILHLKNHKIVICWYQMKTKNEKIKFIIYFHSSINNFCIFIYPSWVDGKYCHTQTENIFQNVKYSIIVRMEIPDRQPAKKAPQDLDMKLELSEEPIVLTGKALNSTSIEVSWSLSRQMKTKVQYYRIQCRSVFPNSTVSDKNIIDNYVKNSSVSTVDNLGQFSYIFNHLNPNTPYQIFLNAITRTGSGTTFKSKHVTTWPKKIPKLKYLHLRLTCAIHQPCVELRWRPVEYQKQWIIGYRIRFNQLSEDEKIQYKVVEKNVTKTDYQTQSSDHNQGFRYEFRVAPFSKYEVGEESKDQIFILEGEPLTFPSGFQMKDMAQDKPTSVSFKWNKLSFQNINGKFDHYELKCYIVNEEKTSETMYTTKVESITIKNLLENKNYSCLVRVWNGNNSGPWTSPIFFKTKDAYLLPPEGIRMIRLSHSVAHITWMWKIEFPIYYSHFLIYYADEKSRSNLDEWSVNSTKSAFTKISLTNLNATVSYVIRLASVSKSKIEGPLSEVIKETSLGAKSWPQKVVSQASCTEETSRKIYLQWASDLEKSELSHFRVNFTGITNFPSKKGHVSLVRDEEEQSINVENNSEYIIHQIKHLRPNTRYTITIEPIFRSTSTFIGGPSHLTCTTQKEAPLFVPKLTLVDINRKKNQIDLLLARPNSENGTVDIYFIIVKSNGNIQNISNTKMKREIWLDMDLENLLIKVQNSLTSISRSYIAQAIKGDDIFPFDKPEINTHVITIGTGKGIGTIRNRPLNESMNYQIKVIACIQIKNLRNQSFQCTSSSWSLPINTIKTPIPETKNGFKGETITSTLTNKGPSTFTMTTVVVILGIVILTIMTMSIFIILKRKYKYKSKLGIMYGSHSTRLSKEKSLCMDHLLKEPLVDPAVRISASESLRFSNHGSNYLEINKLQLSSTPDLLVRSSLNQPLTSVVLYHGPNSRSFEPEPIHVDSLVDHVAKLKENDGKAFSLEYESIEPGQQFTWNVSNMDVNRPKNRYANVIAYDHCRVILQTLVKRKNSFSNETAVVLGSDYINANYIDGYLKPNAYIATQGPLAETIGDFWRMVWEQNSAVIVMMTRLEERDRAKCDQYWPVGGKGSIGTYCNINVTLIDITELAYYTIRKFNIQKYGSVERRDIFQLQFTAWPDHGVPNHPAPLLMFLRRVQSENPRNAGPMIVHCSAGVGRTGAFIVIDYMLERLHYDNTVDICSYVTSIRAQRNYMVQTEEQYIFIHEALIEAIQCGNTEVSVTEMANHIETLNQIEITHRTVDGVQMTGLQMEYEKLLMCSQSFIQGIKNANNHSLCSTPTTSLPNSTITSQPLTFETANLPVNQLKNRIIQMLPPDFSRVNLYPIRGVEGSDYINASWIDGYRNRKAYIAAQSPLVNTSEDFWRMLWEHSSSIIVMLTRLKENNRERSHQYWPAKGSTRYQFFIVDPVAEYNMNTFIIREFKITDTRDSQNRVIRQFQYTDWRESEGIPESTTALLDVLHQVHKTKAQLGLDGPITVHCSAGTARTGIFIALSNVLDRMKNESVVDLFQTVKLLRWQRPALIQSEDQYQFCYTAVLEYLKIYEQINFDC